MYRVNLWKAAQQKKKILRGENEIKKVHFFTARVGGGVEVVYRMLYILYCHSDIE